MPADIALSIVIPIYNEAANISPTIHAIARHVPVPHEVICVYDLDQDTTIPVLVGMQAEYPRIRLVKNNIARGPSGALRAGFQAAVAPRILVLMADLCDDFSQIPIWLDKMDDQVAIVCPSRYCRGGEQQLKGRIKVWLPRSAGWLLNGVAGLTTHDATNSCKLYSADLIRRLRLTSVVSFSVTLEIVAKAHCLGYRIVEVPTVWKDRQHGQTRFNIRRALPAYLKWFAVTLMRNRLFHFPNGWMRSRFLHQQGC